MKLGLRSTLGMANRVFAAAAAAVSVLQWQIFNLPAQESTDPLQIEVFS